MAAGFGLLGMSPGTLWSMTPREFACAVSSLSGVRSAGAMPSQQELAALMRRFPDTPQKNHQGAEHD